MDFRVTMIDDETRRQYSRVAELLEDCYGYPTWRQPQPPVNELVSTILSQNTSDTNRDRAFNVLMQRYDSWEAVRDAPLEDVVAAIHSAGLSRQKGPSIQAALRAATNAEGEISLDFLNEMSVPEAREWLLQIKGIGLKTAAIVLLFAFHKPAFPVDTHIFRVTRRLGLLGPRTRTEGAHSRLEAMIPPEDYYAVHLNLIRHGREICHARRPACEVCPLTTYCEYYQSGRRG